LKKTGIILVVFACLSIFSVFSVYAYQEAAAQTDTKEESEQEKEVEKEKLSSPTFSGLKFRSIGPALTSGRIIDLAVDSSNPARYFVAVASGGVWKTENAGTTWTPVFDRQNSYSIGCITMDPNDPLTLWVGTGENNSQRSVSYGDGVYKSIDGGKNWTNVGLKESDHIGMIWVDPRDSATVFVAAQGPLWAPGGDRGLYKTTDGGTTWTRVLEISENTGVSEIHADPRNPDIMYAAAYQRRRHVWTLIDGGPESAVYKSTDGGETWRKLKRGLPSGDVGRIGLAISPADPKVVYAIVEAEGDAGGFFRSRDRGENWTRQSSYISSSPQYYQEIVADPGDVDRIYSLDTYLMVTEDGGRNFRRVGGRYKHVDDHAMWINPKDTRHFLVGCDGGLYESWDRGATWDFKANLPVTQFYRVSVDNAFPFYNVFGGTQDNFSLGGPSRTTNIHGIVNADWFVTKGGDGFETQVDPQDPNIIYAQSQYGVLARFDRRSGERITIQPQPGKGEEALRWNWNSPLIISPHSHTRLYFAANILFRSDDRGDSWTAVSPDLTRRTDRNQLEVMGRVWGIDAVAKNASTSFYGNITSLTESRLQEGLIFVGTDDGLIQVTEDGGSHWTRYETFPGVPDMTYVSDLKASKHDADTVYAAFDNHKRGDFKPYLLKSPDRGRSWTPITGNLPQRGSVHSVAEDHENPNLLFAGTEFGLFFTIDGGRKWIQLKSGLPTIAVRDLAIQERENDLVLATFGRGFYILDDYSPLRMVSESALEEDAILFPVKKTWAFIEDSPLGGRGAGAQGDSFYLASNPPFGATFTYYLKESPKTLEKMRKEKEKMAAKGGKAPEYPSWDDLRREKREEKPVALLTVRDSAGKVVRKIEGPATAGLHRVTWNLRYPASTPISLGSAPARGRTPTGPMVVPGRFRVSLALRVRDQLTELAGGREFLVEPLGTATLPAADNQALLAFQQKTARLQRAVLAASRVIDEVGNRIRHAKKAILETPAAGDELYREARALELEIADLELRLTGDRIRRSKNSPTPPSILQRVQGIVYGHWSSTSAPTRTYLDAYEIAADEFEPLLRDLSELVDVKLKQLEARLEEVGAPWTPGRVPRWQRE